MSLQNSRTDNPSMDPDLTLKYAQVVRYPKYLGFAPITDLDRVATARLIGVPFRQGT
jgi:hypothetical protein